MRWCPYHRSSARRERSCRAGWRGWDAKQADYGDTLLTVDRLWQELNHDIRFLAERACHAQVGPAAPSRAFTALPRRGGAGSIDWLARQGLVGRIEEQSSACWGAQFRPCGVCGGQTASQLGLPLVHESFCPR